MKANPEVLHPLALALLKHLEDVQGAATPGAWSDFDSPGELAPDGAPIGGENWVGLETSGGQLIPGFSNNIETGWEFEDANQLLCNLAAIATANNTQPALLGGYRMMLGWLHTCWWDWEGYDYDLENRSPEDIETIDHYAEQYMKICQQLCTMNHDCPELTALREALGGE